MNMISIQCQPPHAAAYRRIVDEFSILILSLALQRIGKKRNTIKLPLACVVHIWSYHSYHGRCFFPFWFAHFCWLKSNELPGWMGATQPFWERAGKNQMVRSKWLVFNVIIASHCGKCLDIFVRKHKRVRQDEQQQNERIKKNSCRQRVHNAHALTTRMQKRKRLICIIDFPLQVH